METADFADQDPNSVFVEPRSNDMDENDYPDKEQSLPPVGANRVSPMERSRTVNVAGNPKRPPNGLVAAGSANGGAAVDQANVRIFDYNFHAMKKGVSSALLDVALLMANMSQLKSVYLHRDTIDFYVPMITLLCISIILQIVIGMILIYLGRININDADDKKHREAEVLNNIVVIAVFVLTVANVFIASIGIGGNST